MVRWMIRFLDSLSPLADLALRLWVANVFWTSGIAKYLSMDATTARFSGEYAVPFLPPDVAAYLATGIELLFPVLLAIGLGGRFAAAVLFLFNLAAVAFYPDMNIAAQLQHLMLGVVLLSPLLRGPGVISIDHFIRLRHMGS